MTIIEVAIAATLAALIVAGLGVMIAGTIRAVGERRVEQAAAVHANDVLEQARLVDFSDLMHDSADPTLPGTSTVDPDGAGPVGNEELITGSSGINPAVYSTVTRGVTLTVTRYVTWVDDNPMDSNFQDYKRVSVAVAWTSRGIAREHRVESLVTDRASLGSTAPPAAVDLTPDSPAVIGIQGQEVVQGLTLTNNGPDDRFNLIPAEPAGAYYTVVIHRDLNGNGAKDSGDTPLVDSNADGEVDTGFTPVPNGGTFDLLAVWTPTTSDPTGFSTILVTAETLDAAASDTTNIDFTLNSGSGGGGTTYYAHNDPSPPTGDTVVIRDLGMDTTPPTVSTQYNFSTDEDADPGRYVKDGGSITTTTKNKMANWVYELPSTTTYNGTAQVTLWVAMMGFSTSDSADIQVLIRHKDSSNSGNGTTIGDTTFTHTGTGGYQQVVLNIPLNVTIAAGRWLELKVIVTDTTGEAIYVAYDSTTYPSSLSMP